MKRSGSRSLGAREPRIGYPVKRSVPSCPGRRPGPLGAGPAAEDRSGHHQRAVGPEQQTFGPVTGGHEDVGPSRHPADDRAAVRGGRPRPDPCLHHRRLGQARSRAEALAQELVETVGRGAVIESGLGLHGPSAGDPAARPRHQVKAQHRLDDGPVAGVGVGEGQVDDLPLQGRHRKRRPQDLPLISADQAPPATATAPAGMTPSVVARCRRCPPSAPGRVVAPTRHDPQPTGDGGLSQGGVEDPAVDPAGRRVEQGPSDRAQTAGTRSTTSVGWDLLDQTGAPAADQAHRLVHDGVVARPLGHQQRAGDGESGVRHTVARRVCRQGFVVAGGGQAEGEGDPDAGSWLVSGDRIPAPASVARPTSCRSTSITSAPAVTNS